MSWRAPQRRRGALLESAHGVINEHINDFTGPEIKGSHVFRVVKTGGMGEKTDGLIADV
ncbi:MAG TPA: hypothetical protein VL087_07350 [Nitrospirota bacterium]|nr:hypothetical protein [Nitrospirota bacterium]